MTRIPAAVLKATLCLLTAPQTRAQDPAQPAATVAAPLLVIRAEGVQELLQQWPNTRLGKLLADEEVAPTAKAIRDYTSNSLKRRDAVLASFNSAAMLADLQPYEVAYLYSAGNTDVWQMFRFPVEEVTRAEMLVATVDQQGYSPPIFVTALSCSPRHEGRWTQAFELEAQAKRNSPIFTEVPGTKIGGFPAYSFRSSLATPEEDYLDQMMMARWMLHMPGTFVYGGGEAHHLAKVAAEAIPDAAEIALEFDLGSYVSMFQRMGMGIPAEFSALGFDGLKTLRWSGHFVGELVQDEFEAELSDEPKGLVGALLTGTAKLPAQAMPEGAIAQLRAAINLSLLADLVPILSDGADVPEEIVKDVLAAFDGGVALGCGAPATGGVIPRVFFSANIQDEAACQRLLKKLLPTDLPTKEVEYSGIRCQVLKIPGLPNGIQPSYCVHNGKLHVAESGLSMRAFLKAQEDGDEAMDVGDTPMPQGPGELLANIDLRLDEAQLYESFYTNWLPLYELANGNEPAPVKRKDMPEPEVVAEYVGKTRGILRKQGNRHTLMMLGALGGPETAALAMTWGPMICSNLDDYQIDQLAQRLGQTKLAVVHTAIEAFEKREHRLPKDLAELFQAQNLPTDALLMPGDELAEPVALADGKTAMSSFRYFSKPVKFETLTGEDGPTILIEIRPRRYSRVIMTSSGAIPETYGPDSMKPIDQFGAGSSPPGDSPREGHDHK